MEAEIRVIIYQPRRTKDGWWPPEARREAWDRFSQSLQKGPIPADTLIGSWPPELRGNRFLLFKVMFFVVICYDSLRKLIENENKILERSSKTGHGSDGKLEAGVRLRWVLGRRHGFLHNLENLRTSWSL